MDELKAYTRTEQIYVFITMEAEGESWDLVKLALTPHAEIDIKLQ